MADKQILAAKILTAHGVRGFVKLRVFLEDPENIQTYSPILDPKGRAYKITLKNPIKGDWVASIEGITDRNESEKLRGVELYVDREALPAPEEGEVYIEDLIGLSCLDASGQVIGEVIDFQNFGASDLIEIRPASGGKTYYLPMVEPYVGEINTEERTIRIEPAEEFMA
ncbi:MAG TPA: ribosome maturation factor RimM [Alphaproteobacteria bacterium]|nr:ribosome maturation factor RimM [Alphaproteobacteria bacterium]HRK98572.1 ribosome maturation factor RimM [Alphaproteobacteria bacterium]